MREIAADERNVIADANALSDIVRPVNMLCVRVAIFSSLRVLAICNFDDDKYLSNASIPRIRFLFLKLNRLYHAVIKFQAIWLSIRALLCIRGCLQTNAHSARIPAAAEIKMFLWPRDILCFARLQPNLQACPIIHITRPVPLLVPKIEH